MRTSRPGRAVVRMPDKAIKPDVPPERYAALNTMGTEVGEKIAAMLQSARQEGMKDGLEAAARIDDMFAGALRALEETPASCLQIAMAEFLRDQKRLAALQVGED